MAGWGGIFLMVYRNMLKSTGSCLSSPLTVDYADLIRSSSHGTNVGLRTSPLYIDQYECLTVSPATARHHVLVLTLLRSEAPRRCLALLRLYFGVQWSAGR